jgi:hypothetical protein
MIKIGIIHFDGLHIIHHFLGTVAELYNDSDFSIDILTPETNQDYLYAQLDLIGVPRSLVKKLPTYLYKKVAYKIKKRQKPSNRFIFDKHMKELLKYDVLVFNVFNHLHFNRLSRKPKFVFLMHGSGDGDYPYLEAHKKIISEFDLVTTSGQKINNRFNKLGKFPYTKFEICGYQKTEILKLQNKKKSFFKNDNPIVLYNPHFKKPVSSFHDYWQSILEYFYKSKNYNLIFAPHFNLFNKDIREAINSDIINQKYFDSKNIHIDLGSINSVDMSYTSQADIYLGDVSSQVHEFLLYKLRPCIFINALSKTGKDKKYYDNWQFGKVITNITDLDNLLDTSKIWQEDYREKQKKAVDYTFNITNISSGKRTVDAIRNLFQ